jgi:hypothetical protein
MRPDVSVVTWRHAAMRWPLKGFSFSKRARISRSTGICPSAHSMRALPLGASERSFTSPAVPAVFAFLGSASFCAILFPYSLFLILDSGSLLLHLEGLLGLDLDPRGLPELSTFSIFSQLHSGRSTPTWP